MKKKYNEFRDDVAKSYGYTSFTECRIKVANHAEPATKMINICEEAAELYAQPNVDLENKLEYYRSETAKIRDYVFGSDDIGYPTQSIFEAVTDKIDSLKHELEILKTKYESRKEFFAYVLGSTVVALTSEEKQDSILLQKNINELNVFIEQYSGTPDELIVNVYKNKEQIHTNTGPVMEVVENLLNLINTNGKLELL